MDTGRKNGRLRQLWTSAICIVVAAAAVGVVRAADHDDAPLVGNDQAADIADVYAFRSPQDAGRVVLALTLSDVLPPGQIELGQSIFDPRVLYEFNIDNDGDGIEDRVLQAFVVGSPRRQEIIVRGPVAPEVRGVESRIVPGPATVAARVSTGVTPIVGEKNGVRLFAGVRDDPFFFDLGRFSAILAGQAASFNDPGTDAFAGLNTYAIVIELPIEMVGDPATTTIWATTSR
jgi:hypothetical protein